jgi:hypothetical protein
MMVSFCLIDATRSAYQWKWKLLTTKKNFFFFSLKLCFATRSSVFLSSTFECWYHVWCVRGVGGIDDQDVRGRVGHWGARVFYFSPYPSPPWQGFENETPSQMSFLNMRKTKKSLNNEFNERTSFFLSLPTHHQKLYFCNQALFSNKVFFWNFSWFSTKNVQFLFHSFIIYAFANLTSFLNSQVVVNVFDYPCIFQNFI